MSDRPVIHELKIAPEHFEAVIDGSKRAEVRINDRGYAVGDVLQLREWVPHMRQTSAAGQVPAYARMEYYTGRQVTVKVTHVLEGWGLKDGYVMLSIGPMYRGDY